MHEIDFIINDLKKRINSKGLDTLIHFVTNRCNAKCGFCFYLEELNTPTDELTLEEVGKIAGQLGSLRGLLIGGGEPFLRKDLVEVIGTYVRQCNVEVVQIPTNGFYTERIVAGVEKLTSDFSKLNLTISMSIDAVGEDHDIIRKVPGMFKKIEETSAALTSMKNKEKSLRIIVVSVLTPDTISKSSGLADYVREQIQPDLHWFEPVRGDEDAAANMAFSESDFRFLHNNLNYYLRKAKGNSSSIYASGVLNNMITEFSLENFKISYENFISSKKWPVTCSAGKKIVVLYPNGDLAPCELKDSLVNIRDFDFNIYEALKMDGFEKIRKDVQKHVCDCSHGCFIPASTRNSLPYLLKIFGRSIFTSENNLVSSAKK